jgi:hypothetical protein
LDGHAIPRACLLAIFLVVSCSFARAQVSEKSAQHYLRGLPSIGLFVDGLDEQSQSCGITRSLISDAFRFPVSLSKLQLLNDPTPIEPTFYVLVTTMIQGVPNQCIFPVFFSHCVPEGPA